MANLKNWLPGMTIEEHLWFDACPKSVLFEIARQFGMRCDGDFSEAGGFNKMKKEWDVLHVQNIVPQKPPKLAAKIAQAEAFALKYPPLES